MKLIKKYTNVDLCLVEVPTASLWVSPNMIITPDQKYLTLSDVAIGQVAGMASLANAAAAEALAARNPEKFRLFINALSESFVHAPPTCLMNEKQDVIYRFISPHEVEVMNSVDEAWRRLSAYKAKSTMKYFNFSPTIFTFIMAEHAPDIEIIYMFQPTTLKYWAYGLNHLDAEPVALVAEDDEANLDESNNFPHMPYIAYAKKIYGKNFEFTADDVDVDMMIYELNARAQLPPAPTTDNDFWFSLRELIQFMRVVQNTKHLAASSEDFVYASTKNSFGGYVSDDFDDYVLKPFFTKLADYIFYYDDEKLMINDLGLIFDKLKTPKAHLYFSPKIRFNELRGVLEWILTMNFLALRTEAEGDFSLEETPDLYEADEEFGNLSDITYLYKVFEFYDKLMQNNKFDIYQIKEYWEKKQ